MPAGLLNICTAGSVDDGKSTLIGRLLHDARGLYEDQIHAVARASRGRSTTIDFSLFTDGLKAEREQGITIDVAYRHFATARRKFILADTPGHEQYTRNMATGASTADLAVLLVDARHGLRAQSERHARIAGLLGISSFVLAINKMDLVGYDQAVFDGLCLQFRPFLEGASVQAIPISALHGDNVVEPSTNMPWYGGPPLMEHLETVDVTSHSADRPFRFPVQLVQRTDRGFRGYAGRIVSGEIRTGSPVTVWPSKNVTSVSRIVTFDGDRDRARTGESVVLVLADDVDVGRGDILAQEAPTISRGFEANVVWMDERPLDPRRRYVMKLGSAVTWAEVDRSFALNEIGLATVSASRPLVFDAYSANRHTGNFILIDPDSNFTAGAGMIVAASEARVGDQANGVAARLAALARGAASEAEATEIVHRALEEMLR